MTTQVIWHQLNDGKQSNVAKTGNNSLVVFCEMRTQVSHIDTVSMQTDFDVKNVVIVTVQNVI